MAEKMGNADVSSPCNAAVTSDAPGGFDGYALTRAGEYNYLLYGLRSSQSSQSTEWVAR